MFPASQLITRKFATSLGSAKALPCLKSGGYLVAGGLPWTCSLPWLEYVSRNLQQPTAAAEASQQQFSPQSSNLSSSEAALANEAPLKPDVALNASALYASTLTPGLRVLNEQSSVANPSPLEVLESALQHRVGGANALASSPSVATASLLPTDEAASTHSGGDTSSCNSDSTRISTKSEAKKQRLRARQEAALAEVAALRAQRKRMGLSKIEAAQRWTQQAALRAWMAEMRQARMRTAQDTGARAVAKQAAAVVKRQYQKELFALDVQKMRQLRKTSFHAWTMAAKQSRLQAELESARKTASTPSPPAEASCAAPSDLVPSIFGELAEETLSEAAAETNLICKDGSAGSHHEWGCEEHRVYSAGLLLAHRELALQILANGPPGLAAPPGLTPMWYTEAIPAPTPSSAPKSKKAEKLASGAASRAKPKAAASAANTKKGKSGSEKPQVLEEEAAASVSLDASDFHCRPRGVWASKRLAAGVADA